MFFKNKKIIAISFLFIIYLLYPKPAKAVIPPDFIFNIGSQIVQVFSIIFLFVSTIFITSYQFIKVKFTVLKTKPVFWIISTAVILLGSLTGAVLYTVHKQRIDYRDWLTLFQFSQSGNPEVKKEFFYDRIIISARDNTNQPLLLFLEAGREETDQHFFGHSYRARLLYQGKVYNESAVFNGSPKDIVPHGFVKSFKHTPSEVLPTHTYDFTMQFSDIALVLRLDDLNSDFLVKNGLEYVRFVSGGKAEIKIGNQTIHGKAMVDTILSNDRRVPTLEEYEVKRTSHSATLWDEVGNFYHFDLSEVYTPNIPYKSHKWILYKEAQTGGVFKIYDAMLSFDTTP
jgi:hypothetical protein